MKVLLTVFFDCNGVVHYEFLPQGCTVNTEYYLEVMRRLCEAIRQKCTELCKNQSWILHHDNAPADTSMFVRVFFTKNKTVIMPDSPDLSSADVFFVPKLKTPMKGERFATIEEIKEKSKQELQKCFEDRKKRWHKCITSEGVTFKRKDSN